MTQGDMLQLLKIYRDKLHDQEFSTLKGQVVKGDVQGALKGLRKILKRQNIKIQLVPKEVKDND